MRLSHTIRHRPVHGAPASRSLAAAFVIGVASCWSAGAEATVIPVGQSRQVSAFAFLDPGQGQEPLRCDRTIESVESGLFADSSSCHVKSDSSYVTALADQSSIIGPDEISISLGISAEGRLVPPAEASLGLASSGLLYDFDLDAPTSCRIVADVRAAGGGVVDIAIRVRLGAYVVRWQFSETEESLEHVEVLPPGEYQLSIGGGGDGATGPGGSGSSLAEVDCTVSFPLAASTPLETPAPAAAGAPPRAFPNPARDSVTLSPPDRVSGAVRVFDASGRLVRDLDPGTAAPVVWDTRDAAGAPVARGYYFLRWANASVLRIAVLR